MKEELLDYINELFHQRMKSLIKFIENDLSIEDQVNVDGDSVLDTFYKNHNTVNKMYDNFRLCKFLSEFIILHFRSRIQEEEVLGKIQQEERNFDV